LLLEREKVFGRERDVAAGRSAKFTGLCSIRL